MECPHSPDDPNTMKVILSPTMRHQSATASPVRRWFAPILAGIALTMGASVSATETIQMDRLPLNEQVTLTSGTKVTMVRAGSGDVPGRDVDLLIHYTLTLNGKVTDSSRDRLVPNPFQLTLGVTQLVPGFTAALEGMRVGEIREAVVPPEQGYGIDGNKMVGVPPKSTLYFNLELVGTRKRNPPAASSSN